MGQISDLIGLNPPRKGRPEEIRRSLGAFRWSGRLDLNQRPRAPQGPPRDFHGVSPVSTECHPAEIREVCRTGSFHTEAPNAYETTPFGAPVARLSRVRWLTPGEVAARLRVCRATVYKLCDVRQLEYARVGLSIRISEQQLEAFLIARGASPA